MCSIHADLVHQANAARQAQAFAEQKLARDAAEADKLAARERETPGFPLGDSTGAEVARALLALVPHLQRRHVIGSSTFGLVKEYAQGWDFLISHSIQDEDGSRAWNTGLVILSDGRRYDVDQFLVGAVGGGKVPSVLRKFKGNFLNPSRPTDRIVGHLVEDMQRQVAQWLKVSRRDR